MDKTGTQETRDSRLLTALPRDILQHIFGWLSISDLATLPLVCSAFRIFVKNNGKLCRDVYLRNLVSSWNP